jgi:DNA-binding transcriptional LysR family regulator
LDREGIKPEIVEYVSQIHTMLALVDAGMGVALTPETTTRLHIEGVLLRPLVMRPIRPVETVLSYRKDNDNPIVRIFRNEVQQAFKNGHVT